MKYQLLINKIHQLKMSQTNYNLSFSPSELELMSEALETIQFLEIVFALRLRNLKQENYE